MKMNNNIKKGLCIISAALTAVMGVPFCAAAAEPVIWDGSADTSWYAEGETEFHITTAEQFAGMAELVNGGIDFKGTSIYLDSDLILNDTASYDNWTEVPPKNNWTVIGRKSKTSFNGRFYGGGHDIIGMYQYQCAEEYEGAGDEPDTLGGIFGFLDEYGCIRGINSKMACIIYENHHLETENENLNQTVAARLGGISAVCYYSEISDCTFSGGIYLRAASIALLKTGWIGNGGVAGGICGMTAGGKLTRCASEGYVSVLPINDVKENMVLNARVGGICGDVRDTVIKECRNSADVESCSRHNAYSGGICGQYDYRCVIDSCINSGNIYSRCTEEKPSLSIFPYYAASGGIAGFYEISMFTEKSPVIKNCLVTGTVTSYGTEKTMFPGAVAGTRGDRKEGEKYPLVIENCYYLDGAADKPYAYDAEVDAKAVDVETICSEDFPAKLGRYFVYNENGAPDLAWEQGIIIKVPALKGDANCDGEFTVADLVAFSRVVMGADDLGYFEELDYIKDGVLDAFDMVAMRQVLVEN